MKKNSEINQKAFIEIKQTDNYDIKRDEVYTSVDIRVKPFIYKGSTLEFKLKEERQFNFSYNKKEGVQIKDICKSLEGISKMIREHYSK